MRKLLCLLVLFGAFSASAQRFVRYFDTVTDMAASNPADPNVYVVVGGSVSFNDNQAARWKWVTGSVDPADGNTVVSTWAGGWPGKPAGRWKKINEASGIVIDTSGFITNYNVVVVNDKASLQNINVTNNIAVALVKGKYGLNDGWEGQFTFNAASTAVADDAFYVAPNTGVGMWERQTPNPLREIPATWFDPNLTNGVIQAAINYAASLSTNAVPGREVLLPPKFIELNGNTGLNMSNNVTLVGQNGTVLATSAGTVAGYQMIRANGVTNWGVKNLQLIGLASVGGYGIFVTNSSRGVWGGISFATNFTTAPVWITNSSEIVPFDDKWIKNSVRAYGAQGNNLNNDTISFAQAYANAGSQTGDRITVPPGSYAIRNLQLLTSSGVVLESLNQGGQGLTNYILTPYDPTLPILTIGTNTNPSGYPNRNLTFRGLMFDYRGPSYIAGSFPTFGRTGISIQGGTEAAYFDNCEWQGFSYHGVEIIGGTASGAGVENITFNNPNIQLSIDTATNDTVGLYAQYMGATNVAGAGSDATKITLLSGKMNGALIGHIVHTRGVRLDMLGTYIDGFRTNMVLEERFTNNPSGTENYYYPIIYGRPVYLDNHSTNKIAVEGAFAGGYPWSGLWGDFQTSSEVRYSDGNSYPIYASLPPGTNFLYFPVSYGRLKFNLPGTYLEEPENWIYNDSSRNLSLNSTNGIVLTHQNGGVVGVNATTNAALAIRETTVDYQTLQIAIISAPVDGNSLSLVSGTNTDTRTWRNVVTLPASEILINADTNICSTNLYNQIVATPYDPLYGLSTISRAGAIVTITGGPGGHFTNVVVGSWAAINQATNNNYGTGTILQHNNLTRLIPGGDFHLDNASANAVITVASNALPAVLTFTSTGLGINQANPQSKITLIGNQSAVNEADVAIGIVETNITGSHAALMIQQQADHTADISTATVEGLSVEIGNTIRSTNMTGPLEAVRLSATMRALTSIVDTVTLLHVGVPSKAVGSVTTTNIGIFMDSQGVGNTNFAIWTGSGRHIFGGTTQFTPFQPFNLNTNDQIIPARTEILIAPIAGPSLVLTNTPTITDGYDGQIIIITGASANSVELVDQGTLPGSNITLSGDGSVTNLIFRKGDSHMFHYVGVPVTNWCLIR